MIFYFTATGNSLYIAKQLDDDLYSIPQVISNDDMVFEAEKIGIVCPIFGHEMPALVKEFIKKSEFKTDYFYLVLTYGKIHGGCAELAESYLTAAGKKADYINSILMIDNFLPVFDMNEERDIESEKKIEENLAQIKKDIDTEKHWKQPVNDDDRNWHKTYLDMQKDVPDDYWYNIYRVTDECIGCGICTKVCPANCISIENKKAVHSKMQNCQTCMACIHHCPKKAIQMTSPEKNPNARYINKHIELAEIITANNQKQ